MSLGRGDLCCPSRSEWKIWLLSWVRFICVEGPQLLLCPAQPAGVPKDVHKGLWKTMIALKATRRARLRDKVTSE